MLYRILAPNTRVLMSSCLHNVISPTFLIWVPRSCADSITWVPYMGLRLYIESGSLQSVLSLEHQQDEPRCRRCVRDVCAAHAKVNPCHQSGPVPSLPASPAGRRDMWAPRGTRHLGSSTRPPEQGMRGPRGALCSEFSCQKHGSLEAGEVTPGDPPVATAVLHALPAQDIGGVADGTGASPSRALQAVLERAPRPRRA